MAKARKYYNPKTCRDELTIQVCAYKAACTMIDYSLITQYWYTFLASLAFATISYATFAAVAGSGLSALAGGSWLAAFTIALIQGIAAAAITARFSRFGAHFNPAALLADFLMGTSFASPIAALINFAVMTLAYFVAPFILLGFYPEADLENGRVAFAVGVSFAVGFAAEFVGSLLLAFYTTAISRADDEALSVWGALTGSILVAFRATGGSLNPHLYLGHLLAFFAIRGDADLFEFEEFIAYVFAPTVAFLLAGYANMFFVRQREVKIIDVECL